MRRQISGARQRTSIHNANGPRRGRRMRSLLGPHSASLTLAAVLFGLLVANGKAAPSRDGTPAARLEAANSTLAFGPVNARHTAGAVTLVTMVDESAGDGTASGPAGESDGKASDAKDDNTVEQPDADQPQETSQPDEAKAASDDASEGDAPWKDLFDGKTLKGWKQSEFGGQGEIYVEDGKIVMDFGAPLSGITYVDKFPKDQYELRLEALRDEGNDFFCGLTFPVGDQFCSFILGGWGGALVGLSSIDGADASENSTRQYLPLKSDTWYKIHLVVSADRIRVRLDGRAIIDQPRAGHQFSIRPEVERSKPLGISAFETRAELRHIQWRPLP